MQSINKIPTSKIQRASQLLQTGAKVGVNYVKYSVDKVINDEDLAKDRFDQNNAKDIYNGLKKLKGSALKVAQMLSMDQNILPQAYVDQFSLSQFSVPPLSSALVKKTFRNYFSKSPTDIFDTFDLDAKHAASIGQVHQATLKGKVYAVKIQYPGVADSISSDLAIVKPVALRLFNLKAKDSEIYFKEVEEKLLEETDYELELRQSLDIQSKCSHLEGIIFPNYYSEFSSDRIITMDWMEGQHLSEFAKSNTDNALANQVGQALWDFYMFQIHTLKKVHADPHPGNFLVSKDTKLVALDFGCVKTIPDDFYTPYFELAVKENMENEDFFRQKMFELEMVKATDSQEEQAYLKVMFSDLLSTFTMPFNTEQFDFSDEKFFKKIATMAESYGKDPAFRKIDGNRGSKHFIYMNRTFFGLYNLLHTLKADKIKIDKYF